VVTRETSSVDIIDRVLDKGIVIEYHAHVSVAGIDTLITIDARWLASSIHAYLEHEEHLLQVRPGILASALAERRRR
jgi:hypothetical protein